GVLLCIVALTTMAAIGNKLYSTREESSKRAFLDRLRKSFLMLKTGVPEDREEGMRRIVQALSGRWSELASLEVSQLELAVGEERLMQCPGRHDPAVSARIAAICIEMGPRTAPRLIRALREGTPKARFWSARILGEIKDPRATRSLGDALADKEPDVRSASVWALGMIADRASAALVEPLLEDTVWYVRAHAAEALGRIADPNAVPKLGLALRDRSW